MPEPKRPLKVFLCHAHADQTRVRDLYNRLTKDGVDVWLDKEKLLPGQDWELEIQKAVRESDVVIVCLSQQFNQRGFRQKEVRLALDTAMEQPEGEIFIIPARLEECENLDSLRRWHWVDLFEENGYERLIRALRARADKLGATLQIKKTWLPQSTSLNPKKQKSIETKVTEISGKKPSNVSNDMPLPPEYHGRSETGRLWQEIRNAPTIFKYFSIFFILVVFGLLFGLPALVRVPELPSLETVPANKTQTPNATSTKTLFHQLTPTTVSKDLSNFNLIFISEQGSKSSLYYLTSEGEKYNMTEGTNFNHIGRPAISPNGEFVAFETENGIYSLEINSGVLERLSSFGINPVWSPDNSKIVFETGDLSNFSSGFTDCRYGGVCVPVTYFASNQTIYQITLNEGDPKVTTSPIIGYRGAVSPSWNKDGSKWAFVRKQNVDFLCALIYPDWYGDENCIQIRNYVQAFDWSPTENKIVFSSIRNEKSDIYLFDTNDFSQTNLTMESYSNYSPVWDHSGKQIAFVSDRDGNNEIYIMSIVNLTFENISQNDSNDFFPIWSRDDTKIIFISDRNGNQDIFSIDINTRKITNLTDTPEDEKNFIIDANPQ